MRRTGELTTDALTAAIAAESDEHCTRFTVLVARDLEGRAIEVVSAPAAALDAVRAVAPRVFASDSMPAGSWELVPA